MMTDTQKSIHIYKKNAAFKLLANTQLRDAQHRRNAASFNWIRDGENSNKLFFQMVI